jgi:ADP-ribose pyrophosphatase
MDPKIEWEGKFLRVVKIGRWEFAERVNDVQGVVIIAITPEGKLLLTEQERLPVGKRVIELPAGLAGDLDSNHGENPAAAARRELLEETGYEATEMTWLAAGPPSAGLSSEMVSFFRATGLRRVGKGGGEG